MSNQWRWRGPDGNNPPYAPVPQARTFRRRPWWLLLLIPLLLAACVGAGIAAALLFGKPTSSVQEATTPMIGRTVTVGAHPKIVIQRVDGSVQVSVGQDGIVSVQPTDNAYQGEIPYQQSGNTLTFDLDTYLEGVNVNLIVPALSDLDISASDGDITVDGVSGQLSLDTGTGTITATHVTLKGTSQMDDSQGAITFTGTLDPASIDDFENVRQEIGLTFPANGSFHVDAAAHGGKIVSDFPQIVVSGDEAHGDVGKAPRAQVTISTTSRGSIHLVKAGG